MFGDLLIDDLVKLISNYIGGQNLKIETKGTMIFFPNLCVAISFMPDGNVLFHKNLSDGWWPSKKSCSLLEALDLIKKFYYSRNKA